MKFTMLLARNYDVWDVGGGKRREGEGERGNKKEKGMPSKLEGWSSD